MIPAPQRAVARRSRNILHPGRSRGNQLMTITVCNVPRQHGSSSCHKAATGNSLPPACDLGPRHIGRIIRRSAPLRPFVPHGCVATRAGQGPAQISGSVRLDGLIQSKRVFILTSFKTDRHQGRFLQAGAIADWRRSRPGGLARDLRPCGQGKFPSIQAVNALEHKVDDLHPTYGQDALAAQDIRALAARWAVSSPPAPRLIQRPAWLSEWTVMMPIGPWLWSGSSGPWWWWSWSWSGRRGGGAAGPARPAPSAALSGQIKNAPRLHQADPAIAPSVAVTSRRQGWCAAGCGR